MEEKQPYGFLHRQAEHLEAELKELQELIQYMEHERSSVCVAEDRCQEEKIEKFLAYYSGAVSSLGLFNN